MGCILDTSALICLIKEENGFEEVLQKLEDKVFMSSVNLAEFFAWASLHANLETNQMVELIEELEIEIVDFDLYLALNSSKLITKTKQYGLSLGDRACLGLGEKLKLPVLTCDKVWENLSLSCPITFLR